MGKRKTEKWQKLKADYDWIIKLYWREGKGKKTPIDTLSLFQ